MPIMSIKDQLYYKINKLDPPGFDISRKAVRKVLSITPNFVNNAEMAAYVGEWIKKFDTQYDLIVGIPRSGLMVASLIATSMAKPLATPDRIMWISKSITPRSIKNILVVDDCITTGKSINTGFEKVREQYPEAVIHKGVLFANNDNKWMVDTYCRTLHGNIFQWNLLHFKIGAVGFDMDGVLCEECSEGNDEETYLKQMDSARPYLVPEFEIDFIITDRLEKYRPQTEKWLKDHGVRYKRLVMWNVPKRPERDASAAFKSEIIKGIDIRYYLESELKQAEAIWHATRTICVCTDEMKMFS